MPSNLTSAKHAVAAELSHAKQGLAFYTARVEALETALVQLENVEGEASSSAGTKGSARAKAADAGVRRRGRKPREAAADDNAGRAAAANGAMQRRGRKPKAAGRTGGEDSLPSTGGDFWLDLVSDQPMSAVDIANTAVQKLGLKPEQKDQIQKLKQRVSPALAGLVAAQKIKDSGAGRERRFFKTQNQGNA